MASRIVKYRWSKLIQFFEQNNYIHNGLTMPFLIGAMDLLEGRMLTIHQLIAEFTDLKSGNRTTIMKCDNIGEFVIGIMDIESKTYYNKFPQSLFNEFDNLALTDNSLKDCNTISELISFLEERYNQTIDAKKYSKNAGKWTGFIPIDLERIEKFKNSYR